MKINHHSLVLCCYGTRTERGSSVQVCEESQSPGSYRMSVSAKSKKDVVFPPRRSWNIFNKSARLCPTLRKWLPVRKICKEKAACAYFHPFQIFALCGLQCLAWNVWFSRVQRNSYVKAGWGHFTWRGSRSDGRTEKGVKSCLFCVWCFCEDKLVYCLSYW